MLQKDGGGSCEKSETSRACSPRHRITVSPPANVLSSRIAHRRAAIRRRGIRAALLPPSDPARMISRLRCGAHQVPPLWIGSCCRAVTGSCGRAGLPGLSSSIRRIPLSSSHSRSAKSSTGLGRSVSVALRSRSCVMCSPMRYVPRPPGRANEGSLPAATAANLQTATDRTRREPHPPTAPHQPQWHEAVPLSVYRRPASGTNRQS
jgi:hypothetical protein